MIYLSYTIVFIVFSIIVAEVLNAVRTADELARDLEDSRDRYLRAPEKTAKADRDNR